MFLTDGVTETEVASALRPYTELSYLARPRTLSIDGGPIRTRHGLTVWPRADLTTWLPDLDSLLVPGIDADPPADVPASVPTVYLHDQPGFAFDAALRHIARTHGATTARWVAKSLQYRLPRLTGTEPLLPWALIARPLLLLAATAGLLAAIGALLSRHRRPPTATDSHPR